MATHAKSSTKGQYRQFRITCTQESNGRVSFSAYAKPLGKEWHEHQCILRSSTVFGAPLNTTEDVLCALMAVLEATMDDSMLLPVGKAGTCPVCRVPQPTDWT